MPFFVNGKYSQPIPTPSNWCAGRQVCDRCSVCLSVQVAFLTWCLSLFFILINFGSNLQLNGYCVYILRCVGRQVNDRCSECVSVQVTFLVSVCQHLLYGWLLNAICRFSAGITSVQASV